MVASGPGIYFDGVTSAQHPVTVEVAPAALTMRGDNGAILAEWAYQEIEALSAPEDVLRLGRIRNPVLARLEIRDKALAVAIGDFSGPLHGRARSERRGRIKVVAWSVAATVSLVLVAVFAVPEIATRLAVIIPYSVERQLGLAVESQIRNMLDTKKAGAAFECGNVEREKSARVAFDKLVAELEQKAALPIPLHVMVVRDEDANAITLPGGTIFVFEGLIDNSKTPDELAGVLAHELGHVAHRDGNRMVLQTAGVSFLFGMMLGDFVGGGAVIIAAKVLLQTSYTRSVEAAADAYSVDLMSKVGGDPRALGAILLRIAGTTHAGPEILLDHPETQARVDAINALAKTEPTHPLLDAADWASLKRLCAGS